MSTQTEAQYRHQLVTEALQVHQAQGTLDSPLAQRLHQLQQQYATQEGSRVHTDQPEEQPFTGLSSGARAAKSGRASDKAIAYATSLWNQRQSEQLGVSSPIMYRAGKAMIEKGQIDPRTCSGLIDLLKELPWRQQHTTSAVQSADAKVEQALLAGAPAPLEPGFYHFEGAFLKVKISRSSGRPYAEVWDGSGWDYEAGRGLARRLDATMKVTAEDAKAFGDEYHCCIFCSRELTDERSVSTGYGPVCAEKHSLPWG